MKHILFYFASLISFSCYAQNAAYDSALAKKLGADDYGMKQYVFAFLKNGETKIPDTAKRREIIMAHLANIKRLADEGKLILAGPFLDDAGLAGIFIFNVATMEEAKQLVNTDPGVKAGLFAIELHPWYGSASLLEIPKLHRAVQKKAFED